jgi:hypothetical protein
VSDHTATLVCHPHTPPGPVRAIDAALRRGPNGLLEVSFRLTGDHAQIRVPDRCPPRFAMLLWEHTCFEVFIALDGAAAYHEFNLAPSGEWAAFEFARYREVSALGDGALAPRITLRSTTSRLQLDAALPTDRLSPEHASSVLRLGLSAVVEAADGSLSYWALHHPPGKPDFHHADAFALRLDP